MTTDNSKYSSTNGLASGEKRRVYFNEFNVLMDKAAYLPLVSGLLRAYAETSETIKANYEFMPFLYFRDTLDTIIEQYENPSIAAFSVSMWNEQLNLKVAEEVKKRHPECLIIFGGPNVPHHPEEYFKEFPFVDVAVRAEGEEAFSEILLRYLDSRDFGDIAGVSYRDSETGACVRSVAERPQSRDLDVYPSPYLEGLFDSLFDTQEEFQFQQIIETNRGCPFLCTFCFWGQGGLSRKYRFHGIERVAAEIEWAAQHEIRYVFNADSNFGMHKRDAEIAQILVNTKQKYGFPEKFRTCFGKNTDTQIFDVAKLLHSNDLEKGITLARQSNNELVLDNIKRTNIKMETYTNLQIRFNESNIPVYCELILGLPGETYETWVAGIDDLLQSGLKNQLFVYMCQVFGNTELDDPEYKKKFGIITNRIPLTEIHGAIRSDNLVTEYEHIVTATGSLSREDWRKSAVFSWVTMLMHSMKLGFFVLYYLHDRYGINYSNLIEYISQGKFGDDDSAMLRLELNGFDEQLDNLLQGNGRGRVLPEFGNIYWDEEEASFLRISNDLDPFYDQLSVVIQSFLKDQDISYDEEELEEVIRYQRMRIPPHGLPKITEWSFNQNIPEYFETCFLSNAQPLITKPQIMTIENNKDYQGNKADYARETILWGRKSGTMLTDVSWRDAVCATAPLGS
jgi:radical SAM superfamily enzyme YgiQ (UPF0313 family)